MAIVKYLSIVVPSTIELTLRGLPRNCIIFRNLGSVQ